MKKLAAVLVVLCLMFTTTMAEVYTTGNVNLRQGPGLNYDKIGSVSEKTELEYLGETSTDARGVDWYKVNYNGRTAWISSKYSELRGETAWQLHPIDSDDEVMDLAEFFMKDLKAFAQQAGLTDFRLVQSESPNQYYNDAAVLGAYYDKIEFIGLYGPGYSVFGVEIGMHIAEARDRLTEAGLVMYDDSGEIMSFEHPANEFSYSFVGEYDSCINLTYMNDVVTELDWSAYTG